MTTNTTAPNPLDEALTRLINHSIDAAESVAGGISEASGDAAAFLAAEIPDVIQQLLVWHAIESLIWFLPGLLLIAAPWFVYWRLGGRGKPAEPKYGEARYEKTFTHGYDGRVSGEAAALFALLSGVTTLAGLALILGNLEWLQILVAPKLYLLEYARVLVMR